MALTDVVEPQRDGLVPVGTRHVVVLTGLEPGAIYSYQAISTRVVALKAYWPDKGLSVESPVLTFTTLDARKPAVSFSVVTDTHEDVARIRALGKVVDWKTTEFLVHLGDAFHWLDTEDQLFRHLADADDDDSWAARSRSCLHAAITRCVGHSPGSFSTTFRHPKAGSTLPVTPAPCISSCSTPARTSRTTRTCTRC